MNIFNLRKKFIIWLLVFGIGMACLHFFKQKEAQDPLTRASYFVFSWIQTAVIAVQNPISHLMQKHLFLVRLSDKNKKLKRENSLLQARQQVLEEINRENQRLRDLLDFPSRRRFRFLPAQVSATDFLSKNELFSINKGRQHGVKKFMGVLHPQGVVGYIFRVNAYSSQVISLLSPLSSLPARNSAGGAQGLIEAHQRNLLAFNYLNGHLSPDQFDLNLKIGDKIVSAGNEQIPSGFLIGKIVSLKRASRHSMPKVYVRPAVDFYSLEEVLIVVSAPESDPPAIAPDSLQREDQEKKSPQRNKK